MKDYIEIIYHLCKLILTIIINFGWVIIISYTIYWAFNLLLGFTGSYWLSGIIMLFTCPMILTLWRLGAGIITIVITLLSKPIEDKFFNDYI